MYRNDDIRFMLEQYKAGGANRYVCPQCGRKRCFTRYVDVETGEYVADECGKCNHTASCGYHYPPRKYFKDHPKKWKDRNDAELIHGQPVLGLSHRGKQRSQVRFMDLQERHQTEFFDMSWVVKSMLRTSTFRRWLEHLFLKNDNASLSANAIDEKQGGMAASATSGNLQRVLADYYVGGTLKNVVIGGIDYGPAVVFWLIDEQGRVHDAKLMAYKSDGHRVGNWGNSMRSICERSHVGPQLAETEKVLFGLHLLPHYPDKTVCIVESEKTAIICACHYPQFVWLATGGCGNLQKSKLVPLQGRKIMVYPDSGEYDKWKDCMAGSGIANYEVLDFMEQYEPNTDIADILLGEAKYKGSAP